MAIARTGRAFILGVALAALAAVSVFGTAAAQGAGGGRVRIMHASPDAPPVDIFVDGQKAVTGLAFPQDTGYVPVPAGEHNVKVFASPSDGTGTPVLEANLSVAADKDYTVLAVGQLSASSLELLPLEDNNTAPAEGQAHVRLIHASPDAPAVDVAVAGTSTEVFSDVAYKEVGTYTPVPAGTYDLDVNVASSGQTALSLKGLALEAGTVYTAVAVGLAGNGTLQVVPLADSMAAEEVASAAPGAPSTGTGLAVTSSGLETAWLSLAIAALTLGGAGLAYSVRRNS